MQKQAWTAFFPHCINILMDKHVTEARVDICNVIVQVIDEEEDAWVIGKK